MFKYLKMNLLVIRPINNKRKELLPCQLLSMEKRSPAQEITGHGKLRQQRKRSKRH